MAPVPVHPVRAPQECRSVSPDPILRDSQLQVYDIYTTRRVLWADHARDVNILIWTSRKSVDHGTNDRVMVHGDGTQADGRRSKLRQSGEMLGRLFNAEHLGVSSNVVRNQAGYGSSGTKRLKRKFIHNRRSEAFRCSSPSSGEQASPSIMNRTTALWSIYGGVADTRRSRVWSFL